jgi:hydroxyacylglutathione hydrolase
MSRLRLKQVTVGPWQENCYLLVCPETKDAALVDPGDEFDRLAKMVGRARVSKILLTHADIDHIGALEQARVAYRAPVYVHPAELTRPASPEVPRRALKHTKPLREGQSIRIGRHSLKVFEVPGHAPGHVVFWLDDRALVGDTIFPGGPGHTRTPADLESALYHLQRVVFRWPDRTRFYPGHGAPGTVGGTRDAFMRWVARPRSADLSGDVSWS